jgi:cobaltochelatase CobT
MMIPTHMRMAPQGPDARAVYDAVEQARVEAIGARRMTGVGDNITSMLDDKYQRANYRASPAARMRRLKKRWR